VISTWCSVARPVTPVIVLCNAAVLVVVARNKRMHTPTNYFIVATSSLLPIGLATTTTTTTTTTTISDVKRNRTFESDTETNTVALRPTKAEIVAT